jgi:hypothetical protein
MITSVMENGCQNAIASDASLLAAATHAPQICLYTNLISLTKSTAKTDLVLPDSGGLAAIAGTAGQQNVGRDPITLRRFVELKVPAGGFVFHNDGTNTDPITVYGYGILVGAAAQLAAAFPFDAPITVAAGDDEAVIEVIEPRIYMDEIAAN